MLYLETESSLSRTESSISNERLLRDWERAEWMKIFLDTMPGYGPDVIIICKHTHICGAGMDFFSLLLEY